VTDTGGTPIAMAAVMLEKHGYKDTTDVTGNFLLTGAVGINDQINQQIPYKLSAAIKNSLLFINIQEKSAVEITTYTLQGKVISAINKTMDAGTHSIALPHVGAGVYFYKIKAGSSEFVLKDISINRLSDRSALYVQDLPITALTKNTMNRDSINDVIAVAKAGYLNYRVIVTNSDTSGIEIKMIVCADTVIDIDGNVYQAVQIGNQIWTVENLRTTKFNTGENIIYITDDEEWDGLTTPGYCYYNNTTDNDSITKFGAIYNWHVVNTSTLAPEGWHVPADSEWTELEDYLVLNGYNWDGTTDTAELNKIGKSIAAKTGWFPAFVYPRRNCR